MESKEAPPLHSSSSSAASREFVSLASDTGADRLIEAILPGIHESGSPFVDWFFGGHERARSVLRDWMSRPSSEAFVGRVTLCVEGGLPVGGFIALPGREVSNCRVADAVAAVKLSGSSERDEVSTRLGGAQALFPEVDGSDFYISRIWVSPAARGKGHGLAIIRESIATGGRSGFARFRADVCSKNHRAIRLFRFCKFEPLKESPSHAAEMSYISMSLVED